MDTIFDEIDLLEDDPPHRGVAMRNARFRPYWIQTEVKEWQGLWEKGVFKKWSRKDLLSNDRVFTSRYVYKLKLSAITGEVYHPPDDSARRMHGVRSSRDLLKRGGVRWKAVKTVSYQFTAA
jgi:hypothetical protein